MLQQSKPVTDECAVMIDARDALDVGAAATAIEFADYHRSWNAGAARQRP
jgi:homogentisate 1,2-dioxygenase